MDCLTFLDRADRLKPKPLYVVPGDEDFLKRQALTAIRRSAFGPDFEEAEYSTYPGDKAVFAAVFDELKTVSFYNPVRLIVLDNADPFVTNYRSLLEKHVKQMPATGVLVLNVKSWPATTKLAKMVDADATIVCKAPPAAKLTAWCVDWAKSRQQKQLTAAAASLLVDLIGPEMGQLDQELTKLALYVGDGKRIDVDDVDKLVGHSREADVWRILACAGEGQTREALTVLDQLFDQGQDALRILGAVSSQLRRLAKVARLQQLGQPLSRAMDQAGVQPFAARGVEQQLRHLGRHRAARLYDWLLQVNYGIKGGSGLPPKVLLERLVILLASPIATRDR
jgi:DNA polymerase-3 subunit delta